MSVTDRAVNGRSSLPRVASTVVRGSLSSLREHWALALFSLVVAFGIWFVIEDVENPRVRATFPADGQASSIIVRAINADRLIPNNEYRVDEVEIEGREGDLKSLTADDFEATIDVQGIPANTPTEVPIRVVSNRDGVKVLAVRPATISVTVEPLVESDPIEVRLNPSGQMAAGFRIDDLKIEPLTVTVSGLQDRIDNVASVDLDVNLSALREGSNVFEGELRARNLAGNEVAVTISPNRAKVTYTVQQTFVQRSIPVAVTTTGQVAPGYRITNIVIEPPVLSVSGPADKMASLSELRTEPIPLTNATAEIRLTRNIDVQQENLSLERRQVSVRIEVKPIECTAGPSATPCGFVGFQIVPVPENVPAGLVVTSALRVVVQLTGPLAELDKLTPGSIRATVSLAGGGVGTSTYAVTVVVPPNLLSLGIRAEQPAPISVALATATAGLVP